MPSLDASFLDIMLDTVSIRHKTSQSRQGVPTYGSAVSVRCLVERKPQMVRTSDNEEVLSSATIWLYRPQDTQGDDEVTLPDNTTPPILSVSKTRDKFWGIVEVIYV